MVKWYTAYKKALRLSFKKDKVKLLESEVTRLKEMVRLEIDATMEVVESTDDNVKKTARTGKNKLKLRFEEYNTKVSELMELKVKCWLLG